MKTAPLFTKAKAILEGAKIIAVVGLSDKHDRSSYGVAEYLSKYYEIIPINPQIKEWKGVKAYPSLKDAPRNIDIVNIFRRSDQVVPVVE